jgi:hypothetical protein
MILCKAASLQPTEMLTGTSGIIEGNSRAAQERVYGLGRSAPSVSTILKKNGFEACGATSRNPPGASRRVASAKQIQSDPTQRQSRGL